MIDVPGFTSYLGGKDASGAVQTIINLIPPIDKFCSLFLGRCAVTRYLRPAACNVLNDIDPVVFQAWQAAGLSDDYLLLNMDAMEILKGNSTAGCLDQLDTLIYLDPPYRIDDRLSRNRYNYEVDENYHVDLLSQISAMLEAKVIIQSYPNALYDEMLNGWSTCDYYSKTRGGVALERVYYNYKLADQLHDYSCIGKDFREREQLGRIRDNFIDKLFRLDPVLRNAILSDIASRKK